MSIRIQPKAASQDFIALQQQIASRTPHTLNQVLLAGVQKVSKDTETTPIDTTKDQERMGLFVDTSKFKVRYTGDVTDRSHWKDQSGGMPKHLERLQQYTLNRGTQADFGLAPGMVWSEMVFSSGGKGGVVCIINPNDKIYKDEYRAFLAQALLRDPDTSKLPTIEYVLPKASKGKPETAYVKQARDVAEAMKKQLDYDMGRARFPDESNKSYFNIWVFLNHTSGKYQCLGRFRLDNLNTNTAGTPVSMTLKAVVGGDEADASSVSAMSATVTSLMMLNGQSEDETRGQIEQHILDHTDGDHLDVEERAAQRTEEQREQTTAMLLSTLRSDANSGSTSRDNSGYPDGSEDMDTD